MKQKQNLPQLMNKNWGLELQLTPPAAAPPPPAAAPPPLSLPLPNSFMDSMSTLDSTRHPQQLTISCIRQINFFDMTEIQVRAIIWLARQEAEKRLNCSPRSEQPVSSPLTSSLILQSPFHSLPGISIKRSLQRFLQKRKDRIQASHPYKGESTETCIVDV